jgi:outer membrane protein TolC
MKKILNFQTSPSQNTLCLRPSKLIAAVALVFGSLTTWGQATSAGLSDVLLQLEQTSRRIHASRHDLLGARSKIDEATRRAWTPNMDISHEIGRARYEDQNNNTPPTLDAERTTLRLTQLLTDFGRSEKLIGENKALAEQSQAVLNATVDGVVLDALTAHWSVIRSNKVLQYSRQSEDSIRRQASLENSLVDLGKGYESNVLQAKVQLASAEARRMRAEGALEIAHARVGAIFGDITPKVGYSDVAIPLQDQLPKSLEDALATAQKNNKQIKVGLYRSQALMSRIGQTEAREYYPRLLLVGEASRRSNIDTPRDGALVNDRKLMLQFQYNFNFGMAGSYAVDGARAELQASVDREVDTQQLIAEQVAIAWRNLQVAKANRETLRNQVRIAAKFAEMASAERQMSKRTLLEVLSAEVSLINALSDLVSTEADNATAGLTLLHAVGNLNKDTYSIETVQKILPQIGG